MGSWAFDELPSQLALSGLLASRAVPASDRVAPVRVHRARGGGENAKATIRLPRLKAGRYVVSVRFKGQFASAVEGQARALHCSEEVGSMRAVRAFLAARSLSGGLALVSLSDPRDPGSTRSRNGHASNSLR